MVAERRLGTLRDLVLTLSLTRTPEEFYEAVLGSLAKNPCDLPFVISYAVDTLSVPTKRPGLGTEFRRDSEALGLGLGLGKGDKEKEKESLQRIKLQYRGSLGVSKGHPCAPAEVLFTIDKTPDSSEGSQCESASSADSNATATQPFQADESLPWPFQEACATCKPIFIPDLGDRCEGFEQRGWDEKPRSAVVIPIVTDGAQTQALLVVGLNPRRPFGEAYANWLQLIAKQLGTHIAIVRGYEMEVAKTQELAQLDRAKTAFFSNVNHELRTPLTLILGPLEDVLNDRETGLPDVARDRLQVVSRNAHRLLNLVNSLLDFSRLEAGRMHAIFKAVNLASVTEDLASLFRSAIKLGRVKYNVSVPDEEVEVWLDLDLWEKVVFNIIGNAFKYCLTGSIDVEVVKGKEYAEFSVTDTGCGIHESELQQIFDRFHRVESTSRSSEGTGIGLALTLEVVKLLGGTLDVQSVFGKGSTFTVRLPYGNSHLPENQISTNTEEQEEMSQRNTQNMAIVEEASRWASHRDSILTAAESDDVPPDPLSALSDFESVSASGSGSGSASGSDPTTSSIAGIGTLNTLSIHNSVILLADDNTDMRKYCRSILAKKFKVVEVGDGQAALDYARQYSPDLVVSDIMMPGIGGFELLKALREDPATQLIPVILLSARAGSEARVDGLLAGADDYLVCENSLCSQI